MPRQAIEHSPYEYDMETFRFSGYEGCEPPTWNKKIQVFVQYYLESHSSASLRQSAHKRNDFSNHTHVSTVVLLAESFRLGPPSFTAEAR